MNCCRELVPRVPVGSWITVESAWLLTNVHLHFKELVLVKYALKPLSTSTGTIVEQL
jgi:hypothetical protein